MKISRPAFFLKFFALAACVLAVTVCGLLAAGYNYVTPGVTQFYTPPNPLPPGKPGEIIKSEKIDTYNLRVQAWRVMYHSRDLNGNDIAVSGMFAVPASPPPAGGYPLLAVAHGTEGLGRQCATSLNRWNVPAPLDQYFSFPEAVIVPFVEAGFAVTATDYQGLGAPGDSSFLIGSLEARDVLDSIRAIRAFDAIPLNKQNYIWGHSQGGHAAAFTAQLASKLAPEIQLNGIVLAAPAARLQALVDTILVPDNPSAMTGIAMMVAGSWRETYKLPLETVFTAQGIRELPRVHDGCMLGAILAFNSQRPSAYYFSNPTTTGVWRDAMLLNTPGAVLYPAPVFVAQGATDPVIEPLTTRAFVNALCAAGNVIQYNLYPNADHMGAVTASQSDVVSWLGARTRNEPAPSNCPATK